MFGLSRAWCVTCLAAFVGLASTGCSDACEDAQALCEDCGVATARCVAEADQCATFPEEADYSRDDCCEQIESSYDPCP